MSLGGVLTHDHVVALTILENNSESDVGPGLIGFGVRRRVGNITCSPAMDLTSAWATYGYR